MAFEVGSKLRKGYRSETHVKRGDRYWPKANEDARRFLVTRAIGPMDGCSDAVA
jgi:hypothetical protein